jgi:octaprenyl-diphosphate synthase
MIEDIRLLVNGELSKVNDYLDKSLYSQEPAIKQLTQYSFQQRGKQLRPQLVLIVAGMLGGNITEKTHRGAALISLLHHASLIHDDVVDEATSRRYIKTVNSVWDNKTAVLFGDYLLARSLQIAIANQDYDFLPMLISVVQAMSEGEIIQLKEAQTMRVCEATYLQIVHKKTASLLGTSCAIGAVSISATPEQIKIMYEIGEQLGMAFQLNDDLLDYSITTDAGKSKFMDLKSRTLTLPLIYALQQASASKVQYILSLIKTYNTTADAKMAQEILSFVDSLDGINYTLRKIAHYRQTVLDLAISHLPDSPYKDLFITFIQEIMPINQ